MNGTFAAARFDRLPQRRRDSFRFWLVSIPSKKIFNLFGRQPLQQHGRRLASSRIHPQVQRTVVLPREAAARVVELHGRDAEVREHDVGAARKAFRVEEVPEARVVALDRPHSIGGAELLRESLEARRRLRQLHGVDVHPEEAAAGKDAPEERRRVAAEAQPGVRLAGEEDLGVLLRISSCIALLVLLLEPPRVRPAVARAPLPRRSRGLVRHRGRESGLPTASGSATPSQPPTVGARSYGVDAGWEGPAFTAPQNTSGTWMSYSYCVPCIAPRPGLYVVCTPNRGTRITSPERCTSKSFFTNPFTGVSGQLAACDTRSTSSTSASQTLRTIPGSTRSTSASVTARPTGPHAPAAPLAGNAARP